MFLEVLSKLTAPYLLCEATENYPIQQCWLLAYTLEKFANLFIPRNGLVGKNLLTERVVKYWNRLRREMVESLEVFSKQGDVAVCDIV